MTPALAITMGLALLATSAAMHLREMQRQERDGEWLISFHFEDRH